MTKRKLTNAELEHQLREQLGTLQRAAPGVILFCKTK